MNDSASTARGLLRTARPKQWMKNVLVFAAPGAAGVPESKFACSSAAGAAAESPLFASDFCPQAAATTSNRSRAAERIGRFIDTPPW